MAIFLAFYLFFGVCSMLWVWFDCVCADDAPRAKLVFLSMLLAFSPFWPLLFGFRVYLRYWKD